MDLKKQSPLKKLVVLVSLLQAMCFSVLQAQPTNDLCENAAEVYLNQLHIGSTEGATGLESSSCSYKDRRDVWNIFYPDQRMTRQEALRSYTINNAFSAFEEDIKGSITAGKLADITVLSGDIMTIPDEEILETEVLYTIVGGKIMYQKDF